MEPNDDLVIETPVFRDDCDRHKFSREEVEGVRTALLLNPENGKPAMVRHGRKSGRFDCEHLRVMEWVYTRNGQVIKAFILYAFVHTEFPLFLLRLEIDDARDHRGPFNNPQSWSQWAEVLGELIELALRAVT